MEEGKGKRAGLHGHQSVSMGRITSFSDAVFAVAITLLVLNIKLPMIPKSTVDQQLGKDLLSLWPHYQAYIISFIVIGAFWVGHHQLLDNLVRHDSIFIWLNLMYLMCVVFIPFPTNVMSEYDTTASVGLYAGTIGTALLINSVMIWYAVRGNRLIGDDRDREHAIQALAHILSAAMVFFISIGIACWNTQAAMYFWLTIFPLNVLVGWSFGRKRRAERSNA